MTIGRRATGLVRRTVARAPFESIVVVLAVLYVVLRLSPSSYALSLQQLGADETPLLGTARGIRSDEWAVGTPLFQAAVHNDFQETNETSFYGETLRSFVGLPLLNWGLLFKPLVWPFFAVSPDFAYSFFWAANAALMLIGWSLLLRAVGFSRTTAALCSLILYFSPFVQAWSGPGPQLALFPWVVLALMCIRSTLGLTAALALLVPVWFLSMFYLPGIPPLILLAVALCLAFRPSVFAWRRLASAIVGAAVGVAITVAYLAPVFRAYADSAYPGGRWIEGGRMAEWQVASQFLPATTTERYTNLVSANICEAATVASWLPLLAFCVIDVRDIGRRRRADLRLARDLRGLGVLVLAWALITVWQVLPVSPLSYLLGLGFGNERRTLFASGALLVVAAAYAIDRLPVRVTLLRLAAFASVVVVAWLVASFDLQPTNELALRDELLVLIPAAGLAAFVSTIGRPAARVSRGALFLVALAPIVVGWGLFNPLQSTQVMFRKPDTDVTRRLDALAATRSDGAIALNGFSGAVLNGVGYRSVTHVIVTPSPHLFRPYFSEMEEEEFDEIFNRYAHVVLTTEPTVRVLRPDLLEVPVETMAAYAATGP
jgi:hypothetical protein